MILLLRTFSDSGRLKQHVSAHATPDDDVGGAACHYCLRSVAPALRQWHVRQKHSGETFRCRLCAGGKEMFDEKEALCEHLLGEHGSDEALSEVNAHRPSDLRAARCQKCFQKFLGVGWPALRRHLETRHAGGEVTFDKTFVEWTCRACPDDEFEGQRELLRHLRTEHNVRDCDE